MSFYPVVHDKYEKKAGLIVIRMVKTASSYDDSLKKYSLSKSERAIMRSRARSLALAQT